MAYQGRIFLLGIVLYFFIRSSLIGSEEVDGEYFTQVAFHKLEVGSPLQTIAVTSVLQCGMRCERVPQCLSFNFAVLPTNDGLYECVLLKRTESSENLIPTQAYHHYTRFVKSHMVQPAGSCDNGCCRSQPCQNGGTCVERSYNPKEKFSCTCSKLYNGRVCENELDPKDLIYNSCLDVLDTYIAAGKMPGNAGVYRLRRNDKPSKDVQLFFCAFEGVSKAWTLIESFSLANKDPYATKSFGENLVRNFNQPSVNWPDYRLPFVAMHDFLRPNSTMFRATCDFPIRDSLTPDFLLGYLSDCDIINNTQMYGHCCKFVRINIRGHDFPNTRAPVWHRTSRHVHIDPSYGICSFSVPGSVYDEDLFGYYSFVNPNSTCTATQNSTTQWWLGQQK